MYSCGQKQSIQEINTSCACSAVGFAGQTPAGRKPNIVQGDRSMPYVALEWDHKIGRPVIQWLVVKCQSVGQKFGGPQALPPRRDVAYFVDTRTAERDAKAFAAFKTRQDEG